MRNFGRGKRRQSILAGAIGITLAIACGGQAAFAQSADEEDLPLDTKLFRRFMKDIGLQRDGDNQIEYRERAPLVVPPSRTLPPPASGTAAANNPAWPKDPDVSRQRQEAAAKRKTGKTAAETAIDEGRPLRPNELERGRVAAGASAGSGTAKSPEESARPLRPSELGSKGIFTTIWSTIGPEKPESAPFTAEPPRENLTAPPAGYQTPSPNHPYGVSPKKDAAVSKPATVESRMEGK